MGNAQVASAAPGAAVNLVFSNKQAQNSDASDIFVFNPCSPDSCVDY
jgi:hypothetical protein